jgi:hypothetical protein
MYSLGIYSVGLLLGFMLTPFILRKQIFTEQEGQDLDHVYDQIFLAYKFVDEVEEAPDSCLTEEELEALRDKVLHYEIPYIHQKIIMFYDHKKGGFSYYANSEIIYKYLNVAARRYVLDYGCKQVFKEMVPSMKKEEKTVSFGNFVPKVGKTLLEKEINHYHYAGTFQDFEKKPVDHKKIDFVAYMRLLETIASDPVNQAEKESTPEESVPENSNLEKEEPMMGSEPASESKTSRVLDFLRQFSSIPKSQSTKID